MTHIYYMTQHLVIKWCVRPILFSEKNEAFSGRVGGDQTTAL